MQETPGAVGFGQGIAIVAIRAYRNTLSHIILGRCRFLPSCSVYAEEAVRAFGISRGLWSVLRRLLRCHPFCKGGIDPIS